MKKNRIYLLIAAGFAVVALTFVGCDKGGQSPTSTNNDFPTGNSAPSAAAVEAPALVDPTPDPNQNGGNYEENVTADAAGNVTIKNLGTAPYDGQICYYWNGPHPQTLAQEPTVVHVAPGHTKTIPFPEITFEFEETECEVTKKIQGDVGFIHCTNANSGNLAPAGVKPGPLHEAFYVDIVQEGEGEWTELEPEREFGPWGECVRRGDDPPSDIEGDVLPRECYKERDLTITIREKHSCTDEVRIKHKKTRKVRARCECPCEEEGPTDVGEEFRWFEEILQGTCKEEVFPLPGAVTAATRYECHQTGVQSILIDYTCEEDSKKKRDLCKNVECPCVERWIEQEWVRENVGEWSECRPGQLQFDGGPVYTECEGVMSRTFERVLYEVNSCTQERRVKLRKQDIEESPCGYKCLAGITHTERKRYCGWAGCKSYWYIGSSVKWQCQSVPPGTPGHYDNHFGRNGHDDYFGDPKPSKCYNVTN